MENIISPRRTLPLVTVITIVKNGVTKIQGAIESVRSQDYPCIEHIIKDGLSTDGTLDLLKKNREYFYNVISKPDTGISDAWNQAIECARGDFIALLNCDDEWSRDFISSAISQIMATNSDLVFGDTILIDNNGCKRYKSGFWSGFFLWKGIGFLHPSVVATKQSYIKIGIFRTNLKYAMDADWIIRLYIFGGKFSKHKGVSYMSTDGLSNRNWKMARIEYLKVLRDNNLSKLIFFFGWIWFVVLVIKKNFIPSRFR